VQDMRSQSCWIKSYLRLLRYNTNLALACHPMGSV